MEYRLKRSKRARAMRLAVYPGGELVVTAPTFFGIRVIEHFLEKHHRWIARKIEETKGANVIRLRRADIASLKREAKVLAEELCEQFAPLYGVSYRSLTIRAQKTRWGSCSEKGALSFNYRLAAVPREYAEYVVVHELCHLLEMNHSARFWSAVARAVPEYKRIRKEMRALAFIYE